MWDDRLSRVKAILDCWISVQRRWVYLEGIFFGSAGTAHTTQHGACERKMTLAATRQRY